MKRNATYGLSNITLDKDNDTMMAGMKAGMKERFCLTSGHDRKIQDR